MIFDRYRKLESLFNESHFPQWARTPVSAQYFLAEKEKNIGNLYLSTQVAMAFEDNRQFQVLLRMAFGSEAHDQLLEMEGRYFPWLEDFMNEHREINLLQEEMHYTDFLCRETPTGFPANMLKIIHQKARLLITVNGMKRYCEWLQKGHLGSHCYFFLGEAFEC
ncbi:MULTISPECIES: hypothetical protein [Persicobacter]|uniref:Uncharacterized protein n=1 Tax=Persicobacter diffluens TaxID=981 RepID=A0AAN4VY22_9BACT|nr:hypothetical protein [Persicobacter sp. CCB-QB2]GJM61582.1 hypothetical protein PEDI_21340 [Persicobacter diffluens]